MKRASLLALAIVFLFTFVLAGCGDKQQKIRQLQDKPSTEKTTDSGESKTQGVKTVVVEYKKYPYFAGKGLPLVKDILPKEPKITNEMPEDMLNYEVGTYGETLCTVSTAVDWNKDGFDASYEPLLNSPGLFGKEITVIYYKVMK